MSGGTHELITALVVWQRGPGPRPHRRDALCGCGRLTRAEIERYVAQDRPVDCAGSYKLEERGIVLFEQIESADHTAITGLPLIALATFLRELGYCDPVSELGRGSTGDPAAGRGRPAGRGVSRRRSRGLTPRTRSIARTSFSMANGLRM